MCGQSVGQAARIGNAADGAENLSWDFFVQFGVFVKLRNDGAAQCFCL